MENVRFFSPCGESMICMIDDRQDVWNYAPALIEVRPYFYFKDKDASDNNQEDNDDYLPYLENVLKRIHTEYYSRYEAYQRKEIAEVPDLSKIIPELRRKTLEGTTIVFSGLVPQGSALPIIAEYHCAQGLGAKVEKNVVLRSANANCTTHLIATKTRTKKAFIARQDKDIHIVTPSWLWSCWYHWEREEEFLFSLNDDIPEEMISERPAKRPRLEEPIDLGSSQPQGWGND
ncbi:RNA polymerase II subunit A C-terminal domain phosphatase-like [Takifugu rubripes]|uniref:RNA polymerase II subunit A C-terminal domain phosphatase-like n=1 Tax=Takifugu rubripes TaxID=31033 RepID=UPI0011452692|nr:RNA polymerase II subunit A C-terminal domain phosphatase-like [Takifugu rubripes]